MNTIRLSRAKAQEQTHQRLITAAYQQIAEKGFEGASIQDIVSAAGYTKGAFYAHFDSKDDLLLNLLEYQRQTISDSLFDVIKQAGDNFDDLIQELSCWIQTFTMDKQQALLTAELYLYAARNPKFGMEYSKVVSKQNQIYTDLLSHLFDVARISPPMPIQELTHSLILMVRNSAIDHALYGSSNQKDALIIFLYSLFDSRNTE